MTKIAIKICDVRSSESLAICQDSKVDFIGVHLINPPVQPEKIEVCRKMVREAGSIKTVLLTKTVPFDELIDVLRQAPFDYLQIHRSCSIDEVAWIKEKAINDTGKPIGVIAMFEGDNCDFEKVVEMSKVADFILFDSSHVGGTGKRISPEGLRAIAEHCKGIPYFIAGGLDPSNVMEIIRIAHPYGVDVQSGVNIDGVKHEKDINKVRAFVNNVRNMPV